jgi:hypothetical protein
VTPSDEPNVWRVVSGEVVFGRFPRHQNLVMLVGDVLDLPDATWRRAFTARLRNSGGRIYVTALDLSPVDGDDGELSPWMLRAIRPDAIVRMTLVWIRSQDGRDPVPEWKDVWGPKHRQAQRAAVAEMDAAPPAAKRHGGRPALGEDHWREFAHRCIDLTPQGKGAILRTLAREYGKSERTIANWIQRARDEQWLQSGEKGRAWYAPGERLRVDERGVGMNPPLSYGPACLASARNTDA